MLWLYGEITVLSGPTSTASPSSSPFHYGGTSTDAGDEATSSGGLSLSGTLVRHRLVLVLVLHLTGSEQSKA